jgi:transcriptional regulator with XRE-family HTH domain
LRSVEIRKDGCVASTNRELADFLRRARSQCDPSRAGLPPDGRVRRVPGLRREEVALLAGVSTDYYARLEQGRRITPSPAVIEAIGRALGLDAAGRAHLEDLIGTTSTPGGRRRPAAVQRVRPGLYQLLDALDGEPALVLGRRTDVLAVNRMGAALFADFERMPPAHRNYARWMFLDEDARSLFVDWADQARAAVESLRFEVGRDPDDRATTALVAELRDHSREFDQWWEQHRVHQRTHGSKRLRHPIVGDLTVEYETLTPPGDPDTTLFVYTTEAGSPSRRAMDILASWTAAGAGAEVQHRSRGASDR